MKFKTNFIYYCCDPKSGNSLPLFESDSYAYILCVARQDNLEARQRLPDVKVGGKIHRGRYKILRKQDLSNQLKLKI